MHRQYKCIPLMTDSSTINDNIVNGRINDNTVNGRITGSTVRDILKEVEHALSIDSSSDALHDAVQTVSDVPALLNLFILRNSHRLDSDRHSRDVCVQYYDVLDVHAQTVLFKYTLRYPFYGNGCINNANVSNSSTNVSNTDSDNVSNSISNTDNNISNTDSNSISSTDNTNVSNTDNINNNSNNNQNIDISNNNVSNTDNNVNDNVSDISNSITNTNINTDNNHIANNNNNNSNTTNINNTDAINTNTINNSTDNNHIANNNNNNTTNTTISSTIGSTTILISNLINYYLLTPIHYHPSILAHLITNTSYPSITRTLIDTLITNTYRHAYAEYILDMLVLAVHMHGAHPHMISDVNSAMLRVSSGGVHVCDTLGMLFVLCAFMSRDVRMVRECDEKYRWMYERCSGCRCRCRCIGCAIRCVYDGRYTYDGNEGCTDNNNDNDNNDNGNNDNDNNDNDNNDNGNNDIDNNNVNVSNGCIDSNNNIDNNNIGNNSSINNNGNKQPMSVEVEPVISIPRTLQECIIAIEDNHLPINCLYHFMSTHTNVVMRYADRILRILLNNHCYHPMLVWQYVRVTGRYREMVEHVFSCRSHVRQRIVILEGIGMCVRMGMDGIVDVVVRVRKECGVDVGRMINERVDCLINHARTVD